MMKYFLFFPVFIFLFSACQKPSEKTLQNKVLFSVEGRPVTADEFIYVYEKNNFNNDSLYTEEDVKSYLDLFVNFKLKVQAAINQGLDTTEAFRSEFNQYKNQLLRPYLSQSKAIDTLVREAYDRSQYLINASHILIRLPQDPQPADTLKAYEKIKEIKSKAVEGEDFGKLAREYSEDPSAAKNKGDLGYFSALRMVYPFENAAYNTPEGAVSDVFRTQFGYHILKVHDKKPAKGSVKAAHIMLSYNEHDSAEARNMAFEIYDQLKSGADWERMAKQFSDDTRTKNMGGELSTIQHGQLPITYSEFEEALFDLDSTGQVSDPVRSPYGWHIVKLLEKHPPQKFEEVEEDLERKVKRDSRAEISKQQAMEKLKQKTDYRKNESIYKLLVEKVDSTLLKGGWLPDTGSATDSVVFTIAGEPHAVSAFIQYVKTVQQQRRGITPEAYFDILYDDYVEQQLIDYESEQIVANNKDFRMLVKEYREGILLFEMMDEKVWSRATEDTAGLKQFYQENKSDYMWNERADATIIHAGKQQIIEEISDKLDQSFYTVSKDTTALPVNSATSFARDVSNMMAGVEDASVRIQYDDAQLDSSTVDEIRKALRAQQISQEQVIWAESADTDRQIVVSVISSSKKSLEKIYNTASSLSLQVESGLYEKDAHEALKQVTWEPGDYTFEMDKRYYLVRIKNIRDSEPRKLNEIKGKVISDYQEKLEKDWLAELNQRYTVDINEEVLNKILAYFENK